jgi:hypothetical protein
VRYGEESDYLDAGEEGGEGEEEGDEVVGARWEDGVEEDGDGGEDSSCALVLCDKGDGGRGGE